MGMILITHDLGVVARVADEVAIMYCGQIVETGTISQRSSPSRHPPLHPGADGLHPGAGQNPARRAPGVHPRHRAHPHRRSVGVFVQEAGAPGLWQPVQTRTCRAPSCHRGGLLCAPIQG